MFDALSPGRSSRVKLDTRGSGNGIIVCFPMPLAHQLEYHKR